MTKTNIQIMLLFQASNYYLKLTPPVPSKMFTKLIYKKLEPFVKNYN